MSWQSYIDQLLNKDTHTGPITNCVEHAAIISLADGSLWANTPNFGLYGYPFDVPTEDGAGTQTVNINEIDLFLHMIHNDGASNSPAGIRLNNEKYYKVSSDPALGTIYLKKNGGGACLVKNIQCAVFASWNGGQSTGGAHMGSQYAGLCNEQCEKISEYLKGAGY